MKDRDHSPRVFVPAPPLATPRFTRRAALRTTAATAALAAATTRPDVQAVTADATPRVGGAGIAPRARDLGVPFRGAPGPLNAITDVAGVGVGHVTLISGEGPLEAGRGPVRTGVTAVLPRPDLGPVFGGRHVLNGTGEMTGTNLLDEWGYVFGPVMLTTTYSVGIVRDATAAWAARNAGPAGLFYSLPIVAECYDGGLNDGLGRHVAESHVTGLLDAVLADGGAPRPVAEGNVGAGTGTQCHQFKGGIGTASRRLDDAAGGYTVGALVQTNQGFRANLTIAGVPVGEEIPDLLPEIPGVPQATMSGNSIVVVVATDAPLLPHQLAGLARRAALGIAAVGGTGESTSGDLFLAVSTAQTADLLAPRPIAAQALSPLFTDPLIQATIQATEEAIVNALVAAETMTGAGGVTLHALPHDRLRDALGKYNRLAG